MNFKSVGRYNLSKVLDLSLAKTRVLLDFLVSYQIAKTFGQSSGRKGTQLTLKGKELAENLNAIYFIDHTNKFTTFNVNILSKPYVYSTILFARVNAESRGINERDQAVRTGADGALTLCLNNGIWEFPDGYQVSPDFSVDNRSKPSVFETAVIVFGKTVSSCVMGCANIAFYHFQEKIINVFEDFLDD